MHLMIRGTLFNMDHVTMLSHSTTNKLLVGLDDGTTREVPKISHQDYQQIIQAIQQLSKVVRPLEKEIS